jgi:hypothetical protein
MGVVKDVLVEFWGWLNKWQLGGGLVAAVLLALLGKRRFAGVTFLVIIFAWVLGFMISYKRIFEELKLLRLLAFGAISAAFGLAIVWAAVYRRS